MMSSKSMALALLGALLVAALAPAPTWAGGARRLAQAEATATSSPGVATAVGNATAPSPSPAAASPSPSPAVAGGAGGALPGAMPGQMEGMNATGAGGNMTGGNQTQALQQCYALLESYNVTLLNATTNQTVNVSQAARRGRGNDGNSDYDSLFNVG